jgi:hypothetical protein
VGGGGKLSTGGNTAGDAGGQWAHALSVYGVSAQAPLRPRKPGCLGSFSS